jgi:hypothetical protein
MARSFSGTSQDLNLGTAAALQLTGDFTFACFLRTSSTATSFLMGCYDVSSPFTGWGISINPVGNVGKCRYWSSGTATWRVANTACNDGNWNHYAVSITGSGGTHYRNGATDGTFAHTAPGSYSGTKRIAAQSNGGSPFAGDLAAIGVWNVGLTADEIASLAKGVPPDAVRPANLVEYWPLYGRNSPEQGLISGISGTLTGSPTVAEHPPMMELLRC